MPGQVVACRDAIVLVTEPMYFGTGAGDAHRFIVGLVGWMLEGLDETGRAQALDALRVTLAGHDGPDGVWFDSTAWLVSAVRH